MRVLFDTNVILDVLLRREPWLKESAGLWQAIDDGQITGYMTASSATDIFYIARRAADRQRAHEAIRICLDTYTILPVDRRALELAVSLPGIDFEDNLQVACAQLAGLDAVATRDAAGFPDSLVQVQTPGEILMRLLNMRDQDTDSA